MRSYINIAARLIIVFTVLTGIAYPLLVTGFSHLVFNRQAQGSLIEQDHQILGSTLIGQPFSDPKYFWSRPSGTSPKPYTGDASGGTNQGPTNPALKEAVAARIKVLREADKGNMRAIPIDLVTASGSGLDPHISPAAAQYQLARVARARGLTEDTLQKIVGRYTEPRQLSILGEPRVNVLQLNLALDHAS